MCLKKMRRRITSIGRRETEIGVCRLTISIVFLLVSSTRTHTRENIQLKTATRLPAAFRVFETRMGVALVHTFSS